MTTVPPAILPTTPPPTAVAAGPVVVIPTPPPELVRLDAGTALEVLVRARLPAEPTTTARAAADQTPPPAEPATNAVIRTTSGEVAVRLPPQIEAQIKSAESARIALEILRTSDAQVTARVVAIDGRPPAVAATGQGVPQTPLPVATEVPLQVPKFLQPSPVLGFGAAWFAGKPVPLVQIQPLAAFVAASPSPSTPPSVPGLPPLSPGFELAVRVTLVQPSGTPLPSVAVIPGAPLSPEIGLPNEGLQPTAPAGGPLAATPGSPQALRLPAIAGPADIAQRASSPAPTPSTPATPGVGAAVVTQSPSPAEATPELSLPRRGETAQTPPRPPQNVQPPPALVTVTGTVIATPATEAAVVRTPLGDIQLATRAQLPPGSLVTFEITAALPPRSDGLTLPQLPAAAAGPLTPLSPGVGWPTVTEAIQMLQRSDPQMAQQLSQAIPDGGPKTAVAVMAFAHALRTGDPRAWPGDAALRGLERAGPRGAQLAAEISGEVREMAARVADTGGEWRSIPVPWNADGKIDRVALITRREGETDDDDKKKDRRGGGTRFLINLQLSRLGDMQLDGMFRRTAKSFDLVFRTKAPAPEDMIRELPGLFANSISALGLTGALTFQVAKKFPDPTQGRLDQDRSGLWA